ARDELRRVRHGFRGPHGGSQRLAFRRGPGGGAPAGGLDHRRVRGSRDFLKAPFGLLADRIGRVRVLIGGLLFFVVASGTFALSARAEWILLARALQGVG